MIEILYGPIASGKSTWCKQRAKDGWIVCNDDAITTAVHGGQYGLYSKSIKPLYKSVGLSIITSAIQLGCHIVVDKPNFRKSTRDVYRNLAKLYDVDCVLTIFRNGEFLGAEDGIRRYDADPRGLSQSKWEDVGLAHKNYCQPPDELELNEYAQNIYVPWKDDPLEIER